MVTALSGVQPTQESVRQGCDLKSQSEAGPAHLCGSKVGGGRRMGKMRSFPQPRKAQSADSAGFESFPLLHNDSRLEKSEGALTLRKGGLSR